MAGTSSVFPEGSISVSIESDSSSESDAEEQSGSIGDSSSLDGLITSFIGYERKRPEINMRKAVDESITVLEQKMSFYKIDKDEENQYSNLLRSMDYNGTIRKVPAKLRKLNEDAYTPRVVSIGPIHHGEPQVQAMERYKLIYLNRFLKRISLDIKDVVRFGITIHHNTHMFYEDNFDNIGALDFSQILILDGIFIVELFIEKWLNGEVYSSDKQDKLTFDYRWIEKDLRHDIMLHDNQIPYIFLEAFFQLCPKKLVGHVSLLEIIHFYFDNMGINIAFLPNVDAECCTLVGYLRRCHAQPNEVEFFPPKQELEHIRSATELQEAGVEFSKATKMTYLVDIQFGPKGVLTIPHLKVDEWTETSFRNMVAFEQCTRRQCQYIASYVILMNNIINTPKDADLLVNHGIIENVHKLNVSSLFSNLRKEIAVDSGDFMYNKLCHELNDYGKDNWHHWKGSLLGWKRMLRRDYFSNPWSIISVIAAFVLLILTIVQTVCSVISIM